MKSPIVLLRSLLTDVNRLESDVKGLERDIITIEKRYEDEGDGFLTIALPAFGHALDRGLADGKFTCPRGLKKVRGGAIPRLFSGMLCKVFDIETGNLKSDSHESTVKCLREILFLFKKLRLDSDSEEFLDIKAKEGFFQNDETCSREFVPHERMLFILDRVSSYILPNIDTFDERELECKHGPGAVVEGFTPNQKWASVGRFSPFLQNFGYDSFYLREEMGEHVVVPGASSTDSASSSISKLITVPKNSTSRRTITVEPCALQFVQQGLNALLRENISRCSVLRCSLDLTDQSKNQVLALEGSHTGLWATLDLKSASDLLSVKLVSIVFRHRPRLLEALMSCRSTEVRSGSSIQPLQKYAGMGNATTFPVQSIAFAVLAIASLLDGDNKFPSFRNVLRAARNVRVYGDDIIVPSKHSHLTMDWITAFGLTVNRNKSFTTGNFRESCGVDAYRGVDVTPLYIRFHPDHSSKKEPNTIAHLASLSNHAWLRGLYSMSTYLQGVAERALGKSLPLTNSKCGLLGLHTRRDAHEFHRWDSKLQCPVTKGYMLLPLKRKDKLDGYAALLKSFHVPLLGRAPGHLEKSPVRFKSRIAQRWVPAYAGTNPDIR
jgi:hypothetical protein